MANKQQNRIYKTYPCVICGSDMRFLSNPHKRRHCSEVCKVRHAESLREQFDCVICGKHVTRLRSKSKEGAKAKVCNPLCQAKWRQKLSPTGIVDWGKRSLKAKAIHRKQSHKARARKYRPIQKAVKRFEDRMKGRVKRTDWISRISQRLIRRPKPVVRNVSHGGRGGVYGAIARFCGKISRHNQNPWKMKIANKLSRARKRARVKDEQIKSTNRDSGICEIRAKPIQMCFDWMENNA